MNNNKTTATTGAIMVLAAMTTTTDPWGGELVDRLESAVPVPASYRFCPQTYAEQASIPKKLVVPDESLEKEFNALVEKWRKDTRRSSVVASRYIHPAYQRILAMGKSAIPLILQELKARPDRWFAALHALTKAEPARSTDTFDQAVSAWLKWGRKSGYDV